MTCICKHRAALDKQKQGVAGMSGAPAKQAMRRLAPAREDLNFVQRGLSSVFALDVIDLSP